MKHSLILTCLSLGALSLASCNDPATAVTGGSVLNANGEIANGTYTGATATCNGSPQSSAPPTLVIASASGGTFSGAKAGGSGGSCLLSGTLVITYPSASTITVDPIATSDSPAGCSGATFPDDQGTMDGTFSGSGSVLTINFSNSGCGSGGSNPEVDTWTN